MEYQVIWHGIQQESFDLVNAIANNCTCEFGLMGVRLATCAPHRMLTEDQRALNGLLFARRMAERLSREEFHVQFSIEGTIGGIASDASESTEGVHPVTESDQANSGQKE